MVWLVYGVVNYGYYLLEISMIFIAVAFISSVIAVITKILTVDECANAFDKGAAELLTAVVICGFARGLLYIMGGTLADEASILNTTLYFVSEKLSNISPMICAFFMYVFQSIFNFFVTSGSGQAALTMPLMTPLADMVGVSKQVAVLAFQFGDGFTNMIVPTSSVLIGVLAIGGIDWYKWAKWQIKMQAIFFVLASITLMICVKFGF
jgi:uncharacterized ion transporter superfamily protein YfcC